MNYLKQVYNIEPVLMIIPAFIQNLGHLGHISFLDKVLVLKNAFFGDID